MALGCFQTFVSFFCCILLEGYGNAQRELALWSFGVMRFTESEQK